MKKGIKVAFMKSDKSISRFFSLFMCLILSINLYSQNIQTTVFETWSGMDWENASRQAYTYDGSGFLINILFQSWDVPSSSWKNSTQTVFTNNPDGSANVAIMQLWDGVSAWNNSMRTTYTYNASRKVLTIVTETWLVAFWQNVSKLTYTYDVSGYLITSLYQNWDMLSSSWSDYMKTNYTNYMNGTVNQEITQMWDGLSTWTNYERSTYTYNGSDKVLTDVSESWTAGNWQLYAKETNTYDGSGYLTNTLSQIWNPGSSIWENYTQSNYTNNTDGTPAQIIDQVWDGNTWNNSERLTFTYSLPTRVSGALEEESFAIYPNPADDVITIKGNTSIQGSAYTITDQTGKLLLKGKFINGNSTIDIGSLPNGIYFIHFGERSQHSYKVIKTQSR